MVCSSSLALFCRGVTEGFLEMPWIDCIPGLGDYVWFAFNCSPLSSWPNSFYPILIVIIHMAFHRKAEVLLPIALSVLLSLSLEFWAISTDNVALIISHQVCYFPIVGVANDHTSREGTQHNFFFYFTGPEVRILRQVLWHIIAKFFLGGFGGESTSLHFQALRDGSHSWYVAVPCCVHMTSSRALAFLFSF